MFIFSRHSLSTQTQANDNDGKDPKESFRKKAELGITKREMFTEKLVCSLLILFRPIKKAYV